MTRHPARATRLLVLNERDPDHPKAGGAEIHVSRLCTRLAARGHSVTWYATGFRDAPQRDELEGVRIERRGPLPAYYASVPWRLRRAARQAEFDLVIECLNKVPFYAPLLTDLPVLALCHHLFGNAAYQQVAWPIAAGVTLAERGLARAYADCRFLAISESTREDLIERGIDPARIRVSPPGLDRDDDPLRDALDPTASRPPRLSYVGRLERYKHVELLLQAGQRLRPAFPELELVVIGQGADRARLEALARSLGLHDRTRFTGFVDDRERDALLADSRACVFPSQKEGFGLTVIEANAQATPVVARDAPGLRDSVRHEETGLLVSGEDPDEWATALERLLREDAAAHAMRRAALAWSKRFDWDRAAEELEQEILAALGRTPADTAADA